MLERAPERTTARARALQALGYRNAYLDTSASRATLEESAAICEELGDKAGLGVALGNLGRLAGEAGDYQKERELDERALLLLREAGSLHEAGDRSHLGIIAADLGELADWEGHYEEAQRLYADAVAAFRQVAGDGRGVGYTHTLLGDLQRRLGDREGARESLEFSLRLAREIGHVTNIGMALVRLARLARDEGDLDQARARLDECLTFLCEKGRAESSGEVRMELGKLALLEGSVAQAKSRFAESTEIFRQGGTRMATANALAAFGGAAVKEEEYERGVRLIAAAASLDSFFWTSLDPAERSSHETSLAVAKNALGGAAFGDAWAEGQAMTLEQAVAYALEG